VGDSDFDRIFTRIRERKLEYWADPGRQRAGETYEHNGGQGFYFLDPDGHLLEVMTRPYAIEG
jgi:catechol 2,3-dioxygenase-like lactoylglutathione lyase family enzyme